MEYLVRWEIELDAGSPLDAAKTAFNWMRETNAQCLIFHVIEHEPKKDGNAFSVDLAEIDEDAVLPLTIEEFYTSNFSLNNNL